MPKQDSAAPPILKTEMSEEQIAKLVKRSQAALTAVDQFTRQRPEELRLAAALRNETAYRADIIHCFQERAAGRMSDEEAEKRINAATRHVALSLLTQGRITEAVEFAKDEDIKQQIKSIDDALNCDDNTFCDCDPDKENEGIPLFSQIDTILSPKGELLPLYRCSCCGHLNATHTKPPSLFHKDNLAPDEKRPDSRIWKSSAKQST